jgi:PAS domain S-box-containing protein
MDTDLLLHTTIDSLPVGVIIQGSDNRVIYINKKAAEVFNTKVLAAPIRLDRLFKQGTVIMDEFGNQLLPDHFPASIAAKSMTTTSVSVRIKTTQSEKERWYVINADPVADSKGKLSRVVSAISDITGTMNQRQNLSVTEQITDRLLGTMSYDERLRNLSSLVAHSFADWCSIEILDAEDELVQVSISHKDPKKVALAKTMRQKYPSSKNANKGAWKVINSRQLEMYPNLTKRQLTSMAISPEHKKMLLKLNFCSMVIAPLVARNKVLGIITFAHAESGRKFTLESMREIEAISLRAAILIDNSRLFALSSKLIQNQTKIVNDLSESENTLKLALKAGNMIVWDYDVNTREVTWTGELNVLDAMGARRKKRSIEAFLDHISPQDRNRIRRKLTTSLGRHQLLEDEFSLVDDKREPSWIQAAGEIINNDQGKAVRIVGIARDITEYKLAENKIRANEIKFKSIFEGSLDIIIITDNSMNIIDINPEGVKSLAGSKSNIIKKKLIDIIAPPQRSEFSRNWKKILKNSAHQGTFRMINSQGEFCSMEYNASAHFLPGQSLFVLRDVTQRVTEAERREHLLGITSHELRTPISSIKVFTGILKRQLVKDKNKNTYSYLEKIDAKADTLTHLVSDLLAVTRIQQGKLELDWEMFDVNVFLKQLISEFKLSRKTHKISLTGKIKKDVISDKTRLSQVIINVLKNAVKYSPNADKVLVKLKNSSKNFTITVQDFGVGIPTKDRDKIFNLYYRSGGSTSRGITGLGVGLYISNQIVKAMGGKIDVSSREGHGSTFSMTLPIIPRAKSDEQH